VSARRKVLVLAQGVALPGGEIPPSGSGAHVAATLAGLRDHFEVLAVLAEAGPAGPPASLRRLRRALPGWVRGLRQDLLAIRKDRAFQGRALALGRDFRPDVVYARSEYFSLSGPRVARALGIPLVLEVNGLHARDARTMYRSPLEPLGLLLERRKHRRAAAIVTPGPGLARLLVSVGAISSKLTVVPNSVEPARVRSDVHATRAAPVVIGWVGHLMRWHQEALEFLIDVAPTVVRDVPAVEFAIIGDGPGFEELQARAQAAGLGARFRFLGSVPNADVPRLLDEIDLGVIPAVVDYPIAFTFPVKLAEFGAAGIPVVAPASPSLDQQLVPGREYEPFRVGDAESLRAALVRLSLDAERRRVLGVALQQAVRDRFTWSATGRTLAEVIENVLGSHR
jgi:glycosyltransferase involved in cell wall biosynthesis